MFLQSLFDDSCGTIKAAYERLGHRLGWRFLTSPRRTLSTEVDIALITLNPGGSRERPDHATESSESGSAYIVESWGRNHEPGNSPLQGQIRALFSMLAESRGESSGDELLATSLTGYFVPFRSPSLDTLVERKQSIRFAIQLWHAIFEEIDPKLVVTIDSESTKHLTRIIENKLGTHALSERLPTGWGEVRAELLTFDSNHGPRQILRLPHLSRYGIFERPKSATYVPQIIRAATKVLA